jgi:hypothetical protein
METHFLSIDTAILLPGKMTVKGMGYGSFGALRMNCGMLATGKHVYFDSLRGAPCSG